MAKISSCYQLCPLIDQKSFLGVSDDAVNGFVIVTLGKNIVIRYKLSDQKEVSSWSSKDKLSAPVVYDPAGQQYVGVFNASQISLWEDNNAQLNKIKKYKFRSPIECILVNTSVATPVVVFRNGHVLPLHLAMDKRKEQLNENPPLESSESTEDCFLITLSGNVAVALFTLKGQEKKLGLHLIPLEESPMARSYIEMERHGSGAKLMGYTVLSENACFLLTLWSDGHLYSLQLGSKDNVSFPGRLLTTLTVISPHHPVAMLPLGPTDVAIYGADPSEEGALLVIFNMQLCLVQCKQFFKLYTSHPRLWRAGNEALLLVVGQYLCVVPYQLGKQKLAALVGSHTCDPVPQVAVDWGSKTHDDDVEMDTDAASTDASAPVILEEQIQKLSSEGYSQTKICELVFATALEMRDVKGLTWLFERLNDIPESCLVSTLVFCLKDLERRRDLLLTVLLTPVTTDILTLKQLRKGLTLELVLQLLVEMTSTMVEFPGDPLLLNWATLLLDAYYQHYLLSKSDEVVECLTKLKSVVTSQIQDMAVWQDLHPLLLCIKNKQGFSNKPTLTNAKYTIEQIRLY